MSLFTLKAIREFGRVAAAAEKERAARVATEAGRALIARSRTVSTQDGGTITVLDGDVLDDILAIEREMPSLDTDRLTDHDRGNCPECAAPIGFGLGCEHWPA